jgi:LPXTG-motif cell wall-anchored protein
MQTAPSSALTTPPPRVTTTRRQARVRAAAAGSVVIQNFAYGPATISVNVGDSVTWVNRDSTAHTATANGGTFNTGLIKPGKSASATFSKAGTFAYICAIHPNMRGKVVVTGASAGGGSSSAGSGSGSAAGSGPATPAAPATSSGTPASPSAAGGGPTLPNTGLQVGVIALVGALLAGSGVFLRRLTGRG